MAASVWNLQKTGVENSLENKYEWEGQQGKNLFASAGMKPSDVDLIHLYDGFAPMTWMWLETMGLVPEGEAHDWMKNGTIALDGPHPMNTSGGNLGNGRIHGMTHIHETAMQMMGTAGERQLPRPGGALKKLDVAICETGPHGNGSSFLCTRE
jgi:acetyl-CoA acetyltransferase